MKSLLIFPIMFAVGIALSEGMIRGKRWKALKYHW